MADARAGGRGWILVLAAIVAAAAALGFLKTWPPFATVMSASMAPTIDTGDVVVLKRLDAPAAVGQVVVVHVPDEARARYGYPPVVIHRVASIAADGAVTTKGDAKPEVDPFTVPRSSIDTRVFTHIPAAGQVFGFLGSTLGLLWLAGGAALFFGFPLVERYRDAQRRATGEREERELVMEELRAQVELLPAQIERAVANAVAGIAPRTAAPAPVAVRVTTRFVSAAEFAAAGGTRRTPPPAPPAPPTPRPAPMPVPIPLPDVRPNPAPAPPAPPAPPSRFPAAPPVSRFVAAIALAPRPRTIGALCAVGGP